MSHILSDHRIEMVTQTCQSLFAEPSLKLLGIALVSIFTFLFGDLTLALLLGLPMLIFFDAVTGLLAARQNKEDFILSRLIMSNAIKLGVYAMFLSAGSIAENSITVLPDSLMLINDSILAVLVLSELSSVAENAASMGYATPKKLLNKIKNTQNNL
jgi:phage-related holin